MVALVTAGCGFRDGRFDDEFAQNFVPFFPTIIFAFVRCSLSGGGHTHCD
jgi:hypothetical protein